MSLVEEILSAAADGLEVAFRSNGLTLEISVLDPNDPVVNEWLRVRVYAALSDLQEPHRRDAILAGGVAGARESNRRHAGLTKKEPR